MSCAAAVAAVGLGLLALVVPREAAAQAPECVPRAVLDAIRRADAVRVARLGPRESDAHATHDEVPGQFLGHPDLERIAARGGHADRLRAAFGRRSGYSCAPGPGSGDFGGDAAGEIGLEFERDGARVRMLVHLPGGAAEVGFASGVRFTVSLAEPARRAWWEFLEAFARERHVRPSEFLADMLEEQRRGRPSASPAPAPHPPMAGDECRPPAYGPYVPVDELPDVIERVACDYPRRALEADVEGVVLVQALVGCDGSVLDARVQTSLPPLDEAAVACVKLWRFRPAKRNAAPVATWFPVPVRFVMPGGF